MYLNPQLIHDTQDTFNDTCRTHRDTLEDDTYLEP